MSIVYEFIYMDNIKSLSYNLQRQTRIKCQNEIIINWKNMWFLRFQWTSKFKILQNSICSGCKCSTQIFIRFSTNDKQVNYYNSIGCDFQQFTTLTWTRHSSNSKSRQKLNWYNWFHSFAEWKSYTHIRNER